MPRMISRLASLPAHALQGYRKFRAMLPIYGWKGALGIVFKNVFMVDITTRMDKDMAVAEKPIKPVIPLQIEHYQGDWDVDQWEFRDKLLQIRGQYGVEQFKHRLARGDIMFAAYAEQQCAGFVWLEFTPGEDVGYRLAPDEAYTHDAWTFDEFRGKRVFPIIQQAIMDYTRRNFPEVKTLVTHVYTWNKASLGADQKAGYVITGLEYSVFILGYHFKIKSRRPVPEDIIVRVEP